MCVQRKLVVAGDHGSARDAPANHGDVFSEVFFDVFCLDVLESLEPQFIEGQRMGTDEKPQNFGLVAKLCLKIIVLQGGAR